MVKVNANFDERVVVHTDQMDWLDSPMPGVRRRLLDRVGDEVARATSIVEYAPGSQFSPHTHTGGEEFLVLSGVFQDEHGDYPAGSYVRNPPTSSHTPGAQDGCVLFVKLWQFDLKDREQVHRHIDEVSDDEVDGQPGVTVSTLYDSERETVRLIRLDAGASYSTSAAGGHEALILSGSARLNDEQLGVHDWARLPTSDSLTLTALGAPTTLWLKSGQLRHVDAEIGALRTFAS